MHPLQVGGACYSRISSVAAAGLYQRCTRFPSTAACLLLGQRLPSSLPRPRLDNPMQGAARRGQHLGRLRALFGLPAASKPW